MVSWRSKTSFQQNAKRLQIGREEDEIYFADVTLCGDTRPVGVILYEILYVPVSILLPISGLCEISTYRHVVCGKSVLFPSKGSNTGTVVPF